MLVRLCHHVDAIALAQAFNPELQRYYGVGNPHAYLHMKILKVYYDAAGDLSHIFISAFTGLGMALPQGIIDKALDMLRPITYYLRIGLPVAEIIQDTLLTTVTAAIKQRLEHGRLPFSSLRLSADNHRFTIECPSGIKYNTVIVLFELLGDDFTVD